MYCLGVDGGEAPPRAGTGSICTDLSSLQSSTKKPPSFARAGPLGAVSR